MNTQIDKFKQVTLAIGIALSGIGSTGAVTPANALTFNFTPASGTSSDAIAGFAAAGNLWSSVLTDNVTVNIDIGFTALSPGTLGEASSTQQQFNYAQVYTALNNDKSSADDLTAVNSLSTNSTFKQLLNRTANNPNGYGSATPYVDNDGDANNQTIDLTTANAKALGLRGNGNTTDAAISFSNLFTWDFDRSNGILAGAFDFVGIAAHEIGHALGFISGVDILDGNSPTATNSQASNDDQFTYVSPLDLFRYSSDSKAVEAIDWTADAREKYFSIDGGATKIATFATGTTFGDGRQASHWQDNLGLGIMDPAIAAGELLQIIETDRRALDAIGWNLANNVSDRQSLSNMAENSTGNTSEITRSANTANVPEPADFVGTLIFAAVVGDLSIKQRRKLAQSKQATVTTPPK
ncbi:NF038122 family metalloprotease [Chamaesiphon sp.]|uniref:NF038122 family metalloprotease n=1 Tax=Chamaesiphon sp. TaxID=2814140 RepID=UPI00359384BD